MKKINHYKRQLWIGLIIIPITFILLMTLIGMAFKILKFQDFTFNFLSSWIYAFRQWYCWLSSFLISIITYFYYGYKICFTKKEQASVKPSQSNYYGQAKWLTKKAIKQLYPFVNTRKDYSNHGFVTNSKMIGKTLFHNIRTNTHSLVICGTGSGKTQGLVLPTIKVNAQSQSNLLLAQGYQVKVLNLRNITASIAWNPLQIIYDQFQLMLLTNSQQEKLHLKAQIQTDIQDLTKTLFINKSKTDPFWNDSGALITEAIILGILEKTEIIIEKNNTQDKKIINKLLNQYLPINQFNLASVTIISSLGKDLVAWFKSFPDTSIAKITANQVLQTSSKTLTSILMTMSTNLDIFKNDFIRNLTCQNDLDFNQFITKPTALFIVIPDENQNYYDFVTLLIMQLYKFLILQANNYRNNKLPRPVYFLCDEFGNLPPIPNITKIITIARSRNIFWQLIIQDLQQLKEKYDTPTANIIFTNCSLHIFLQTMDLETAQRYSNMIGQTTVLQIATNTSDKTKSRTETLTGHLLISASDLMKLKTNQAIVLYAKENPFKATLIPWYQNNPNNNQTDIIIQPLNLTNFPQDYYYDIKL